MKAGAHLKQRDAKKLALANNARLKRVARKKLEKQTGGEVTEEMVAQALAQRNINQLDDLSRKESANHAAPAKVQPQNNAVSYVKQLPQKALKKNVSWLSPKEQDATADVSLTHELQNFAEYVGLDEKEAEARSSMLLDIQDAVQSKFPGATISQFGSHPVGLSIFLSDVDVSVDNINAEVTAVTQSSGSKSAQAVASQSLVIRKAGQVAGTGDSGSMKRPLSSTDSLVNKKIKFDEQADADEEVGWTIDGSSAASAPYITSLPPPASSRAVPTLMALQAMCAKKTSTPGHCAGASSASAKKHKIAMDDCYDDDASLASSSTEDCDNSYDSDYLDEDSSDFEIRNSKQGYGRTHITGTSGKTTRSSKVAKTSKVSKADENEGSAGDTTGCSASLSVQERRARHHPDGDWEEGQDSDDGGAGDSGSEGEDAYFEGVLDAYDDDMMDAAAEESDVDSHSEGEGDGMETDLVSATVDTLDSTDVTSAAAGSSESHTAASTHRAAKSSKCASTTANPTPKALPKLTQDIDVPFWDGISPSASNAALSSADGVLDETLAENLYLMDGAVAKAMKASEQVDRKEKLAVLQKLQKTIRSMAWVQRMEFRKFARVPIINLTHKNGVECDISLDMSQQATSLVVRALLQRCGPALVKLSAFLKIYLNQLALDAPFTGGLGSYKLYVLLAKHIERNPHFVTDPANLKLGPLLMSFLKYYGNRFNLNEDTVVEVEGAEAVSFDRTNRVNEIRVAFDQAFAVLNNIQFERELQTSSRQKGPSGVVVPRPTGHSFLTNQLSNSALASLLNTEHLAKLRQLSRNQCHKYPHRSGEERDAVARELLKQLNTRVSDYVAGAAGGATLEEVKASNPALAARLRSFPSAGSAIAHLSYLRSEVHDSKRGSEVQEVLQTIVDHNQDAIKSLGNWVRKQPVLDCLESQIPLLALLKERDCEQWDQGQKFTEEYRKVVKGSAPVPPHLVIRNRDDFRNLPEVLRQLGPFRTMFMASKYMGKSYPELLQMQQGEADAIEKIRSIYGSKTAKIHEHYVKRWVVAEIIQPKSHDRVIMSPRWTFMRYETIAARECVAKFIEEQRLAHEKSAGPQAVATSSRTSSTRASHDAGRVTSPAPTTAVSLVVAAAVNSTVTPAAVVDALVAVDTARSDRMRELESKVPILLAADPFSVDLLYMVFDPSSAAGKRIIAKQDALPRRMIVTAKDAKLLDKETQQNLGPFRTLALAEQYVNKPYLELVHQRAVESAMIAKVRQMYESHSLPLTRQQHVQLVRRWTVAGLLTPSSTDHFYLDNNLTFLRGECTKARDTIEKYIAERKALHDSGKEEVLVVTAATEPVAVPKATSSSAASSAASRAASSGSASAAPVGEAVAVSSVVTAATASSSTTLKDYEHLELQVPTLVLQNPSYALNTTDEAKLVESYRVALGHHYLGKPFPETVRLVAAQDMVVGELVQMFYDKLLPAPTAEDGGVVGRLVVAGYLPLADSNIDRLTPLQKQYRVQCKRVYEQMTKSYKKSLEHDKDVYGPVVTIPEQCMNHRPRVDCTQKQVADLLKKITTLSLQNGLTSKLRLFHPSKAESQEIIAGTRDMPETMCIAETGFLKDLPAEVAEQLGRFHSLAAAKLFCNKSYDKLYDMLHTEQEALKEVNRLYATRRLRFSHPNHQHLLQLCANARYIDVDGETLYVQPTFRTWVAMEANHAVKEAMNLLEVLEKGVKPSGTDLTKVTKGSKKSIVASEAPGTAESSAVTTSSGTSSSSSSSTGPIFFRPTTQASREYAALLQEVNPLARKVPGMMAQVYAGTPEALFHVPKEGDRYSDLVRHCAEDDFAAGELYQWYLDNQDKLSKKDRDKLEAHLHAAGLEVKVTKFGTQKVPTLTHEQAERRRATVAACLEVRQALIKMMSEQHPEVPVPNHIIRDAYGMLYAIPPECVIHREGVDLTAQEVTDLRHRIPLLSLFEGLKTRKLMNLTRKQPLFTHYIAGTAPLPQYISVVADDLKALLPAEVQAKLGPFRSLAAAAAYYRPTRGELERILKTETDAISELQDLYATRRLRFTHPDHQHLLQACANLHLIDIKCERFVHIAGMHQALNTEAGYVKNLVRGIVTPNPETIGPNEPLVGRAAVATLPADEVASGAVASSSAAAGGPSSSGSLGKRAAEPATVTTAASTAATATETPTKKAKPDATLHKRKSTEALPAALDVIDLTDETTETAPAEKMFKFFVPSSCKQSGSVSDPTTPAAPGSSNTSRTAPTAAKPAAATAVTAPAVVVQRAPVPVTVIPPPASPPPAAAEAVTAPAPNVQETGQMEISLSKPMMRRGPGGRSNGVGVNSATGCHSAGGVAPSSIAQQAPHTQHTAAAPAHAVIQESREIQQSIDALKQKLDESRKRHSIG